MPSVSEHIAAALAAHVTEAFGLMGNGNAFLLDALARTPVRFTAVRHETAAVASADAYFRVSGRLAVATTTYGAGFTNALTSLAEAAAARIPVLLVAGDAPTTGLRGWDVDQPAVAGGLGAQTVVVAREEPIAATIRAIELALESSGPVVLAIPYDLAAAEAGELPAIPALRERPRLLPDDAGLIGEIAARLVGAKRPVLLAGRGAHLAGASEALGRLAAATGALTASSALGRGIFPDARYDLGVAGGFGQDAAMALIRNADVAVVIGASLNQFTMRFGELFAEDALVVQLDTADGPTNPRVDRFLRADAAIGADLLAAAVTAQLAELGTAPGAWRETVDLGPTRSRNAGDGIAPDGRLDPRSVAARIGELLPAEHVVVSDGGHFIGWANMYWPVESPERMVMVGTAYQSIGLGFPSLPGAARADEDATIVLTTGDGGGLMGVADFETAIRVAGGRGLVVVWNDGQYSAETTLYRDGFELRDAEPAMLIPELDFAALANALGGEGVVVRELSDLERLAGWAAEPAASRGFLLLDCRISREVVAPYQEEIVRFNLSRH